MLEILLFIVILISSFFLLIKSSDYLVSSASILGKRAGISKFVIGLTLVAVGTSLPELFTAIFGIISSSSASSFVFGTIIGSNIANTLLVFGMLLVFAKNFKTHISKFDIIFLTLATTLVTIIIFKTQLNFYDGIILLLLFAFYMYYTIRNSKNKELEDTVDEVADIGLSRKSNYLISLVFLISLVGLNLAAKGVVYSIENLGIMLEIPIQFLTLTTVAFATSLPEVMVTYSTAKKKEYDIAIGNIIGSNITNILLILGVSGIMKTISFELQTFYSSIIFLIFVTIIFNILIHNKKSTKNHGIGLLSLYFIYIIYLFL